MCAKKNLSAKDLSEKFGFQVSEKDLEPEIDKDSRYLNQMADLSGLIAEQERTAEKKVESEPEKKPEKEPTFAELFESRGSVAAVEEKTAEPEPREKTKNKLVNEDDDMDFGRLFSMSGAKVVDKDKLALPDEEYEPFEISEDAMSGGGTSFHGFDDLAKALGGKKKR